MRKYVKNYSNYVIKKKHQDTNIGTIYERDWVTIGSKERYGTWDKRMSYHGDSNFVFTTTNFPSFYRRQKKSPWLSKYFYESVKDASDVNNVVKVNYKSNDIRDFAYYGSSEELVRASIENIIRTFPGYMRVKEVVTTAIDDSGKSFAIPSLNKLSNENFIPKYTDTSIHKDRFPYNGGERDFKKNDPADERENISSPNIGDLYVLDNPLGLNITSAQNNTLDLNDNKFLSLSYEDYLYTTDGLTFNKFENKPKVTYVGYNNLCTRIEWLWIIEIADVKIYGIDYFDKLIYLTDTPGFMIVPKEETMNLYFNSLDNFEQVLLNRESKPKYSNRFVTPKRNQYGTFEVIRNYTWPSNKIKINNDYTYYPVDVSSASYSTFLTELIELAALLDEIYTDNIWGKMVHEAIKNYDWSYKRTLNDDTVEDNIEGGMLVENLLRLYGRAFDNIKRSIEGIGFSTNVTYNGFNNVTEAELTDKLNYMGWEIFSIIPNFANENGIIDKSLTPEPLSDVKLGTYFSDRKINEYGGYSNEQLTPALMENEFMRRLIINSNRILKSKGTIESIDMIMGLFGFSRARGDFEITEEFRKTFLKPINYTALVIDEHGNYVNSTKTLEFGEAMFDKYGNNHIVKTNEAKRDIRRLYSDDKYSGIPLNEIYMKEKVVIGRDKNKNELVEWRNYKLLAPYYKHDQRYDSGIKKFSELYFQADGGWAKFDDGDDYDNVDFMETINYLKVLPSVSDLFDQPYRNTEQTREVKNEDGSITKVVGDIFYVISVADYCDYYKDEKCPPESHFFVCVDRTSIGSINGWKNIDLTVDTLESRTALYLDSLTNNSSGNNPHVGYGRYDMGERYWSYIENPFAFALSDGRLNKYLPDGTPIKHINEGIALSEFEVSEPYGVIHGADSVISYVGGKSKDGKKLYKGNTKSRMLNSYFKDYTRKELNEFIEIDNEEKHGGYILYDEKNTDKVIFSDKEFDSSYTDNVIKDSKSDRYIIDYKNGEANKKHRKEAEKDYVLNSKILVFKNNLDNKFFKMYFRDVILPYLIQVIPSTTIIRFVGLDLEFPYDLEEPVNKPKTIVDYKFIADPDKLTFNKDGELTN